MEVTIETNYSQFVSTVSTLWSYVYDMRSMYPQCDYSAFVRLPRESNRFQVQESKTILRKRTWWFAKNSYGIVVSAANGMLGAAPAVAVGDGDAVNYFIAAMQRHMRSRYPKACKLWLTSRKGRRWGDRVIARVDDWGRWYYRNRAAERLNALAAKERGVCNSGAIRTGE